MIHLSHAYITGGALCLAHSSPEFSKKSPDFSDEINDFCEKIIRFLSAMKIVIEIIVLLSNPKSPDIW